MKVKRSRHPSATTFTLAIAVLLALGSSLQWAGPTDPPTVSPNPAATSEPPATPLTQPAVSSTRYSNIYPEDYVGPETCGECHKKNYRLWKEHPHSRMNLNATDQTVLGDFSGVRVRYGRGEIVFTREDGDFAMLMLVNGSLVRRYKVTKVVGSRAYQFYLGLMTFGPEAKGHASYSRESKLPFAYLFRLKKWLPEMYFDSFAPAEDSYEEEVSFSEWIYDNAPNYHWDRSCIACHNTYPYAVRFQGSGWAKGFPEEDIWLNAASDSAWKKWMKRSTVISPDDLVTLGISCESCHLGGREHAERGQPIRFVPTAPDLLLERSTPDAPNVPEHKDPYVVNSLCAQCHSSPGVSRYPNGAGRWNSSESIDLSHGACAGAVKCTDCHNPHRAGPPVGVVDPSIAVSACLGCHESLKDPGRAQQHSHHSEVAGVTCLDCHMPRIVQGLDSAVLTHTISSPSDPDMLAAAAPNACNVCHLDKSIRWTLRHLKDSWGTSEPTTPDWKENYGRTLGWPMGRIWLRSKDQVTRLITVDAYSRSPLGKRELPRLLESLSSEYAVNRLFGVLSIRRLLGRNLTDDEYDLLAPPASRKGQIERLKASWSAGQEPAQGAVCGPRR
jgi:predicted CXXCH cytochrome family protein